MKTVTLYKEDQRLSPYVSEWLLAWGASMNIQRCSGTGFMKWGWAWMWVA